WEASCEDRGLAPGQVALAWLLHRPGVLGPIIGPRTMEQLDSAIGAVHVALSEDDLAALDEIFPGPGVPAPEAYAWRRRLLPPGGGTGGPPGRRGRGAARPEPGCEP